jgi:hypothetical protein
LAGVAPGTFFLAGVTGLPLADQRLKLNALACRVAMDLNVGNARRFSGLLQMVFELPIYNAIMAK